MSLFKQYLEAAAKLEKEKRTIDIPVAPGQRKGWDDAQEYYTKFLVEYAKKNNYKGTKSLNNMSRDLGDQVRKHYNVSGRTHADMGNALKKINAKPAKYKGK